MCEKVGLECIGDGDLEFLDALVRAITATAVHLCKGCNGKLSLDGRVGGVPLASAGARSQIDFSWKESKQG